MKRFINRPPGVRSRRCANHDYRGGAYFVTTNTKNRALLFGTVERGRMYLNRYGKIVAEEWQQTGELRAEVSLDAFIVMPDHVHGLLWIVDTKDSSKPERRREACQSRRENAERTHSEGEEPGKEESRDASRDSSDLPPGLQKRKAGTLSTIIGCFKAAVTRRINKERGTPGKSVWQSSFHDHIVRNRKELRRIRRYIRTNSQEWSRAD